MKYVGDLEKRGQRFGETCSAKMLEIWRNVVGNSEKLVQQKRWRFGEIWSVIRRNLFGEIRWRWRNVAEQLWRSRTRVR